MYISALDIENVKLLRKVAIDFANTDRSPRMWTVFVGQNGVCKTTLLQAIALAASGGERANQVAEAASYRDKRAPRGTTLISGIMQFSSRYHAERDYPGLDPKPQPPPLLVNSIAIHPDFDLFRGLSNFRGTNGRLLAPIGASSKRAPLRPDVSTAHNIPNYVDPLDDARAANIPHWFVAGYGVGRMLPAPMTTSLPKSITRDRIESLFDPRKQIVGTGFVDLFPEALSKKFSAVLHQAITEHHLLPNVSSLELRARGNISKPEDRVNAHHLGLKFARGEMDVPTIWLSAGYQATLAWIADLVGQLWLEAGKPVALEDMEGICLIDELDLHLHPTWQAGLVTALKKTFPRIQFIATTHSPMILPGLTEDEIILLDQDEEGNVVARKSSESPKLMTGDEIYRKFFDVQRLEPAEVDTALFRYASLAGYAGRSDEDERQMQKDLAFLKAQGVDPGMTPVPRTPRAVKKAPKAKRPRATRKR